MDFYFDFIFVFKWLLFENNDFSKLSQIAITFQTMFKHHFIIWVAILIFTFVFTFSHLLRSKNVYMFILFQIFIQLVVFFQYVWTLLIEMKRSRLHLTPPAVLFAFLLFFLLKYGFFCNLHFFIDVYLILAAFCFVSREKFEIFLAENTLSGKMNIAIKHPPLHRTEECL